MVTRRHIYGSRCASTFRINHSVPRDGLDIVSLNGRLWCETGFLSNSLPSAVNIILHKKASELKDYRLNLEFP